MALTLTFLYLRSMLFLLGLGLISGCSTASLFAPYPYQAQTYREAIVTDDPEAALKDLTRKVESKDRLLYHSERGRMFQLMGDYAMSQADFEVAIDTYQEIEDKAHLSARDVFSSGASLLSNDNAIPYEGYGYERVFLHLFQSFNYIAQGNIEAASVELRRASLEQRQLELFFAREVEAAQIRADEETIDIAGSVRRASEWSEMDSLVSDVKGAFQNAYVFYASAVIWEALGDYNRANVDFRKALELNPDNHVIRKDVRRTAIARRLDANQSTVVVLVEQGFVPARQSFKLPIPDVGRQHAVHTIAFPYYSTATWPDIHPLRLTIDGQNKGETVSITRVGSMAVKALKQQVPTLIVRQLLRARAKYELQKRLENQNPLLGFSSSLYAIISERADLRNWLTLPANVQLMRLEVDPGRHQVDFSVGTVQHSMTIDALAGRVLLIRVFNPGERMIVHSYQL